MVRTQARLPESLVRRPGCERLDAQVALVGISSLIVASGEAPRSLTTDMEPP